MPCTSPLKGWRSQSGGLTFKKAEAVHQFANMSVACGQCMDCRIDRSRAWALRCVHESQKHLQNAFITLTYAPEHLPYGGTLVKKDFQDFMKRLRKSIHPKKISFFHCGEYGDALSRPHYHALLFGHDFPDKKFHKTNRNNDQLFISETLEKLWGKGLCTIGAVTAQSAAYCSAYILKKITGQLADDHYRKILPDGSVIDLQPEYITMSVRPAIGLDWITAYGPETYPSDTVILRGKETKPPRYYDKQLKKTDVDLHDAIKAKRKSRAKREQQRNNNKPARLAARKIITASKINLYKRNLE